MAKHRSHKIVEITLETLQQLCQLALKCVALVDVALLVGDIGLVQQIRVLSFV
jgi:hypothetical protein